MVDQRFSVSVHIMTAIAYEKGELVTSEELAAGIRTNPTVVRRLISKLVEAGLLNSFKGKTGGVRLAKPAKEVTLRDIYSAIADKKLMATPDKEPFKNCVVSCSMKKLLCEVADGIENNSLTYLESIRLSDLLAKIAR